MMPVSRDTVATGTGRDFTTIRRLLAPLVGDVRAGEVLATLAIDPALADGAAAADRASRGQVAMALNAALFLDLLERVPTARRHVDAVRASGQPIVFDHGALRTIDDGRDDGGSDDDSSDDSSGGMTGTLPPGHRAFLRFLAPLGYEVRGLYPLPALTMTGRALVHVDFPETIPQFFVSELHLPQLPEAAQAAARNVFGGSRDPLGPAEWRALDALARDSAPDGAHYGHCTIADGVTILQGALRAFGRQHPAPALADYRALLEHSREGAWIATEGNAFNHATTRVPDVVALAEDLKAAGYPLKPTVEVSRNGRVRQTAFLADQVIRPFRSAEGTEVALAVPGSFYEFISRDVDPATGTLDLTFDSGNATGIFAVTRGT